MTDTNSESDKKVKELEELIKKYEKQNKELKTKLKEIELPEVKEAEFGINGEVKDAIIVRAVDKETLVEKNSGIKEDNLSELETFKYDKEGTSSHSSLNHWGGEYKKTIDKWILTINEMSFIYQYLFEIYRNKLQGMNTALFIIASLTNLVTISQFITATEEVQLGIQVSLVLINFAITLMSGILKIFEWNKKVESYTAYNQRLDDFFTSVMNETTLPPKMRKDAASFIMQYKDMYFEVIKTAPPIDLSDYQTGLKKFSEFLDNKKDNFIAKKRERLQEYV
jgi:hypothetical protein